MADRDMNPEAGAAESVHQEQLLGHPEPWEGWETKFVLYSIGIGIGALVVLGALINIFIL